MCTENMACYVFAEPVHGVSVSRRQRARELLLGGSGWEETLRDG